MDDLEIADLVHRLRMAHRIMNPAAMLKLADEAAAVIERLHAAQAPRPTGRPRKEA